MELINKDAAIRIIDEESCYNDIWNILSDKEEKIRELPGIKAVPIKEIEGIYEKYQKKLWARHEDVRGDYMIELGSAEEALLDLLAELGCWDEGQTDES